MMDTHTPTHTENNKEIQSCFWRCSCSSSGRTTVPLFDQQEAHVTRCFLAIGLHLCVASSFTVWPPQSLQKQLLHLHQNIIRSCLGLQLLCLAAWFSRFTAWRGCTSGAEKVRLKLTSVAKISTKYTKVPLHGHQNKSEINCIEVEKQASKNPLSFLEKHFQV